jgi:hypothetical protein
VRLIVGHEDLHSKVSTPKEPERGSYHAPGEFADRMSDKTQNKSRWRTIALLVFIGYVGAHFVLSRASLAMVRRDWGLRDAFIYVPVRPDVVADNERPLLYIHIALRLFFAPVWSLDKALGGPYPMTSMPLRGLSK